ncbi:hypothetical protein LOAG_16536 [Loa loa]|uniref:Uncharacterized protein n=1 Tax=Loa loa TaxID=7209 RepID=A0A1S0ULR0_LOALO|nr:hypothetical protein LOAG_16536 [Loa loa]EJD76519.1 hypothetical protein LOAG_16536 [Loa loa]
MEKDKIDRYLTAMRRIPRTLLFNPTISKQWTNTRDEEVVVPGPLVWFWF